MKIRELKKEDLPYLLSIIRHCKDDIEEGNLNYAYFKLSTIEANLSMYLEERGIKEVRN